MTSTYRVMRSTDKEGNDVLAVHEVHCDERRKIRSWTEEPVRPVAKHRLGVLVLLARMAEACCRPVLDARTGEEVEPEAHFPEELADALDDLVVAAEEAAEAQGA